MEKSDELGGQELLALLMVVMSAIIFFNTPRRFFLFGANAAWLSVLVSIAVAIVCIYLVGFLLRRHPRQSLMALTTAIFGPALGLLVNLLFMLYFLSVSALNARLLGEAIVMTALPNIPVSVIVTTTIAFSLYASLQGWNTIAKACWVSLPFLAVGVMLPLVLTADRWNADLLFPLLGAGLKPTLLGGVLGAGILGEALLAAVLAGAVQPEVRPWRISLVAVAASGFLFLSVVLATSMVFPYPVAEQLSLPYYMLSRTLTVGRFLQRLEAIALVLWGFAALIKIAIDANATLYIFGQVFQIKDHKPLLIPHGAILFSLAILPGSFLATTDMIWTFVRLYGGAISLLLPVLITVVGLIKLKPSAGKEGNA